MRGVWFVVPAVLVALTACSGETTRATVQSPAQTGFRTAYQKATDDYVKAARDTGERAAALNGDEATTLKVYAQLADQVDAARRQYAALPTPAQVAPQVTAVVRLLGEQVTLLRRIGPDVKAKDASAVQGALTALSRSTTDLARARAALDAAVQDCGTACS